MYTKTLYALDFDGVICNSAVETAITGWKAAQGFWPDMQSEAIRDKHIQQFRQIRPCLEFGSEAVLIMRLLQQGVAMSPVCEGYHQQLKSLMDDADFENDGLYADALQTAFGETRDREIQQDEAAWVASNPLFDGIADKLKTLDQDDWFIVTTKQERFVKHILQASQIELDEARIFGLDRKLSKQALLTKLKDEYPERPITFIEDRLPTLIGVQRNPDLQDIKLQLVDWGYNTETERIAAKDKAIEVIGLNAFLLGK